MQTPLTPTSNRQVHRWQAMANQVRPRGARQIPAPHGDVRKPHPDRIGSSADRRTMAGGAAPGAPYRRRGRRFGLLGLSEASAGVCRCSTGARPRERRRPTRTSGSSRSPAPTATQGRPGSADSRASLAPPSESRRPDVCQAAAVDGSGEAGSADGGARPIADDRADQGRARINSIHTGPGLARRCRRPSGPHRPDAGCGIDARTGTLARPWRPGALCPRMPVGGCGPLGDWGIFGGAVAG